MNIQQDAAEDLSGQSSLNTDTCIRGWSDEIHRTIINVVIIHIHVGA